MKRKATILALVLIFALSFGSLSVFAAAPPTEATRQDIKEAKVQCTQVTSPLSSLSKPTHLRKYALLKRTSLPG